MAVLYLLAPWLSSLPGRGIPATWQQAALVLVWKGKGSPTNASKYHGISVLHPVAKLFSLRLLHRLDPLSMEWGWRARELVGFHPRYRTEDHQLLVTYLC